MKARFLVLALAAASATAGAQVARRSPPTRDGMDHPERPGPVGGLATLLLDARRELNLTPRQLVALDSIERQEFTQRRQEFVAMRARRDSACANRQPCELTLQERRQMDGPQAQNRRTSRMHADSATRSKIFAMLDTTQRRLADRIEYRRELAGPRGGSRWMREARRGREFGPPRMRGERFGPPGGPRFGPPGFDDQYGPRLGPPGWRDEPGPARRRWRGGEDSLPPDTTGSPTLEK